MKTKNLLLTAIAVLFLIALIYFGISFITMNMDATIWSRSTREFFAFLVFCCFVISPMIYMSIDEL